MKVDIKGAIEHTGLTEYAIRKLIWAKRIPYDISEVAGRLIEMRGRND